MAETQNPKKLERKKQVLARLDVGLSHLDENLILRNPDEPHVPGVIRNDGSPIPRLKLVPLGDRAVGFFSDDVDALIEALRDAKRIKTWPRPPKAKATAPPSRPIVRSRSVRR